MRAVNINNTIWNERSNGLRKKWTDVDICSKTKVLDTIPNYKKHANNFFLIHLLPYSQKHFQRFIE